MWKQTLITITMFATITPAAADRYHRHGSVCSAKNSSVTLVGADERGTYNASSSSTANVTCAANDFHEYDETNGGWASGGVPNQIEIHVRDLSTTTPFDCYAFATQEDGFSSWSPHKYACETGGGCTSSTADQTGLFMLRFTNVDDLDVFADYVGIVCNIPPTSASGNSYIKGVWSRDALKWESFWSYH